MPDKYDRLPVGFLEDQIQNMMPGDDGWSVPWALSIDGQGRMYLNGRFTIKAHSGGTLQLYVLCDQTGDYHVELFDLDYRYSQEECFDGDRMTIPVKSFSSCGDPTREVTVRCENRALQERVSELERQNRSWWLKIKDRVNSWYRKGVTNQCQSK